MTQDAQRPLCTGSADVFGCMRHSYPSTNSRYKLSTKFSDAQSTNSGTGSQPPSSTDPQPHSTTTYQSNSGKVTSLNAVTAALQPGGSFASPDSMGGACNYGECPAWQFTNDHFSYALPDGTTADFTNFSGTADFTNQSDVKVKERPPVTTLRELRCR